MTRGASGEISATPSEIGYLSFEFGALRSRFRSVPRGDQLSPRLINVSIQLPELFFALLLRRWVSSERRMGLCLRRARCQ
jgi:hypothetical protein